MMRSLMKRLIYFLLASALTACAGLERDPLAGGVLEPAAVTSIRLPERIEPGADAVLEVVGLHPDGCTRLDRFETGRTGNIIEITAWASRALGSCDAPGKRFAAKQTLAGLSNGIYEVRVNDSFTLTLAVVPNLSPGNIVCAPATTFVVNRTTLPATSHPGGHIEVQIEGTLPSWCDTLDVVTQTLAGNILRLDVQTLACSAQFVAADCPGGPQPVSLTHDLGLLPEGRYTVEVNGTDFGAFDVVSTADCNLLPLAVGLVDVPTRVQTDQLLPVTIAGTFASSCAAIDDVSHATDGQTVRISVTVRECDAGCVPDSRPVSVSYSVDPLTAGEWSVEVNGTAAPSPLEVLEANTCWELPLPPGSIEELFVSTRLTEQSFLENQPLDVLVRGTLQDGCWDTPLVSGRVEPGRLVLTSSSLRCTADCGTTGDPFIATFGLPEGLDVGEWELILDGEVRETFVVQ